MAALTLGGCAWLKAHIDHPVPVKNAVGDSTTTFDGKTVHAYRGERYLILGPTEASITAALGQIDRAYFEFRRYFGVTGARLALVMFAQPDSISASERSILLARGYIPTVYVRPRNVRDLMHPYEELPREAVWPVAPAIARKLLAGYAAQQSVRVMPPPGSAAHDSLLDEFPQWYRAGVAGLIGDPGAPDRALELVRDRGEALVPLANLLTRRRLDIGDTTQKPVRDLLEVLDAEGLAFLLYATEQEGPRFVGRIADVFIAGGNAAGALHDVTRMPRDLADLDRLWRKWVEDQR